jgi:hypothetical protein
MSYQNHDTHDELDNELRGLFVRATAQIAPRSDLAASVEQRLAQGGSIQSGGARRSLSIAATLSAFIVVALLAGVLAEFGKLGGRPGGSPGGTGAPAVTATSTPFRVTSVDLAVNPTSIAGRACGNSASFTYTATVHIPAHTAGGTIQYAYTLNNGRSQTPGAVKVGAGATSATFTFESAGVLSPDHTYPAPALVMISSPNSVISPAALPGGACVSPSPSGAFQVTSVSMAVNPTSVAGQRCGSYRVVTYTATFHLAANGPGGTIRFEYTVNNGRGSTLASIAVAAGKTTVSYSFKWSGTLPTDHTAPEGGGVVVRSPTAITSPLLGPSGRCS